jgi:hypothetical protein
MYEDPEMIRQCKIPADMLQYIDQMNLTDSLLNLYRVIINDCSRSRREN